MERLIYLKDVVSLDLDAEKCVGCGMCLLVCPHEVFYQDNGSVGIQNRDACMECGACAKNCAAEAISVCRRGDQCELRCGMCSRCHQCSPWTSECLMLLH